MDLTRPVVARATLTRNVAPGIHRLSHAYVNCYFVEDASGVTIVDAALPATWMHVRRVLTAIGRTPHEVRALVLTHAHFDHLGFARRIRDEWGVPVYAHLADHDIAAHPYRYAHENPRSIYPILHPRAVVPLAAMVRAGALAVPGLDEVIEIEPGAELDVPGSPRVVFSPGHTFGHCALHIASADALLCGDAVVTFNPYTAGYGAQIVSGAATADSEQALVSLEVLAATGARLVLPGHGRSWRDGIASAAAQAMAAGPS